MVEMLLTLGSQARLWACGRGDMSTPSFVADLKPISTRGADYAHPILVSSQNFESHRRTWLKSILISNIGTFYKRALFYTVAALQAIFLTLM